MWSLHLLKLYYTLFTTKALVNFNICYVNISSVYIFISELQKLESENSQMEVHSETLDETLEKLRSMFSTTEMSYSPCLLLDDPKILALIDPNVKLSSKEILDEVCPFLFS